MFTTLPILCALVLASPEAVESKFVQVAPFPADGKWTRTRENARAVVLIHGFMLRLRKESVPEATLHSWQRPGSLLVRELSRNSDVFAFAYGQDADLEKIILTSGLGDGIKRLRRLGYREIVLVGHSAGGLVARQFIEDNPTCGVTKVIQVCCPNAGTPSAAVKVHRNQQAFVDCLSPRGREKCLTARKDRTIPESVEFVCIVGHGKSPADTDGVVPCVSQWPVDLQKQSVPAVRLAVTHFRAMRSTRGASAVADLIRRRQPRWTVDQVLQGKKAVLTP